MGWLSGELLQVHDDGDCEGGIAADIDGISGRGCESRGCRKADSRSSAEVAVLDEAAGLTCASFTHAFGCRQITTVPAVIRPYGYGVIVGELQ